MTLSKTKSVLVEVIPLLFIFLFMYTSLSKLLLFPTNLSDLHRSPLLGPYAGFLAIFIPAIEIAVSALLLFSRTRFIGLLGSAILMIVFTVYVAFVLANKSKYGLPCTCGGIIRQLTWRQHLVFNIFFTFLSVLALWLHKQVNVHNKPLLTNR